MGTDSCEGEHSSPPDGVDVHEWSRRLKAEWQQRACSSRSNFYIASHVGWQDETARQRQAELDCALVLTGLPDAFLSTADVFEVGCGYGRLVPCLAPRVQSYTGMDIAPTFVAQARAARFPTARFFETDGSSVPEAAKDRTYDLIFSAAVLIHCPLAVIHALVPECLKLLSPTGRMRIQLLADPHDLSGIITAESLEDMAERVTRETAATNNDQSATVEAELATDTHCYMGHAFTYAEAAGFAKACAGSVFTHFLLRMDPLFIYVEFTVDGHGQQR